MNIPEICLCNFCNGIDLNPISPCPRFVAGNDSNNEMTTPRYSLNDLGQLIENLIDVTNNIEKLTQDHKSFNLNKDWLNSSEAAEYLGITKGSLDNRIYRGELNPDKFGQRKNMFKRSDLDRLIVQGRKN